MFGNEKLVDVLPTVASAVPRRRRRGGDRQSALKYKIEECFFCSFNISDVLLRQWKSIGSCRAFSRLHEASPLLIYQTPSAASLLLSPADFFLC